MTGPLRAVTGLAEPWLPLIIPLLAVTGFYHFLLSGAAMGHNRERTLRWRIKCRLNPGPGYAPLAELVFRWGRLPALHHGKRARPGLNYGHRLITRTTDFAVRLGRGPYARRCYGRQEDQVGVIAPQRSGKTGLLIDRIIDHPGPVIAGSSRTDIHDGSAVARSRRGPIEVFNPMGTGGLRSTFSWNLLGACDDEMSAYRMADWLAGATPGYGNVEWFEAKGKFALGALLLAAQVNGNSITDVYWWIHSGDPRNCPAIKILNGRGNRELAQLVIRILGADRTAGSVRDTIDKTLQFAAMPELAEAASRGGAFDHLGLLAACGTLYLVTSGDANSLITPLIRALASWVHFEAGLAGSKTRYRKLDPPLLMALDEVSVTVPIDLPAMLSDSAGKGILIQWVAHSISQLDQRWGKHGAETIIATSGVLILLGGIKNPETLDLAAQLSGTVGGDGKVPVMPVDVLRMLPNWRALIIRTNLHPVVVKFRPYWRRWNYRWPLKYRQMLPAPVPLRPLSRLQPSAFEIPETIALAAAAKASRMASAIEALDTERDTRPVLNGSGNGHKPLAWQPDPGDGK